MRRVIASALICAAVSWSASAQEIQSPINGHYYQRLAFTPAADIWADLQAEAVVQGGNLVTIRSAAENQWLVDTFGPTGSVYIGFNDIDVEGAFEWVSGEALTYQNWNGGEPNDASGEDVAELQLGSGGWNDNQATQFQDGIMERIAFEFQPSGVGGGFTEVGSDVVLAVAIWGNNGAVTYQWFKDGVALGGETASTLTLTSITAANDGSYTAQATDADGTITSGAIGIKAVLPGSLPVAALGGLVAAIAALGLGGVAALRRRKK